MSKNIRKTQPLYIMTDVFFMLLSFFIPYFAKYNALRDFVAKINYPNFNEYCFIYLLWATLIIIFFKNKHLYRTDRSLNIPRELYKVISRIFYAAIIVGFVVFFVKYKFFSRLVFGVNFCCLCIFLGGWRVIKRIIIRKLIRGGFHNINVLIVGNGKIQKLVLGEIRRQVYLGWRVVGILGENKSFVDGIPFLGSLDDFVDIAQKHFVDEVVITLDPTRKEVSELIGKAQNMKLGVQMVPKSLEQSIPIIDVNYIGTIPLLAYKNRRPHPSEITYKRLFDLIVSLILILLLLPVFILVAIAIKVTSNGPIVFTQKRVGLKGRLFKFYKFRSMIKDAEMQKEQLLDKNEVKGGVMFKIKNDPRVTSVGKFLRKYSLDELPQLINVMKGDMSLVGPRPPLPNEVKKYGNQQINRLSIRPGITGLSQVRGRSELPFSRWVKWDLWYINNWSFLLDIKIIIWTVLTVLKGKGAC